MEEEDKRVVLFAGFNQDAGCIAIGVQNGFKIFNSTPLKKTFERVFEGGISYVEMLYRTNILALVGGGSKPVFTTDKVMLWDDS